MKNRHYIIPIFVPNEGCPHKCVFCNQSIITGNGQVVDADFVRKTVEEYLKTIRRENSTVEISFFGGTFTDIPMKRQRELLKIAKEYKDSGDIDFIHLSTRPDYINKNILDNLKYYSVKVIELGIQSLDREVLVKSGRGHSPEDVKRASFLIKEYGFTLGHQVMLGLPCDSFDKDIKTVKESIAMKPDIYRLYPALVIKQTPMEIMYRKGIYKPYDLDGAVDVCRTLYCILRANKINVIRIGLQPTEEINVGADVVAGPFHPAFRELVEGSIYNSILEHIIPESYEGEVEVRINNRDLSKLYADKKKYFIKLEEKLRRCSIKVIQSSAVNRETLIVDGKDFSKTLSVEDYITKEYLNKIIV
ncbi:radical SAM protein [Clostridium sp. WLY-B-L2]|uniref:Radical SAM protein n=1 Tax=Clostridium aromativorans TaxID=2836848 RepID=A0ABS8N7B9_9CLOT|nr:radical SAM protein [Clostridium aromativorans]MCC9294648.1 radical SAM protein [Clostridium aromativorans]